jgi:hypothetical protein
MSDLSLLSFYLGVEVKQASDGISLSQSAYTRKILGVRAWGAATHATLPWSIG